MAPTSPVHFQHDLPLGPLRVGSHSVFRRFTPNWFESSKKPFSHQDGHDVKNYRQQERIFALFHSIEPGEQRWASGSIDVEPDVPFVDISHRLHSLSVFLCFAPPPPCAARASLPHLPGDKRALYQTVTPTDACVHTHSGLQELTNSAGGLLLLALRFCLHSASSDSFFTAPVWTEFEHFLSLRYIQKCRKVSEGNLTDLGGNPWRGH